MKMAHSDLSSLCTVEGCKAIGKFDLETDDGLFVSLLCGRHANELVSVTPPATQRYAIVQHLGADRCSILDTVKSREISIAINLTGDMDISEFSRDVAEKLIDVIQSIDVIDSDSE